MRREAEKPEVGALARPRTRREIMKLAALGLGAAAGTSLFAKKASAQTTGVVSDLDILNFLLPNEIFESQVFYPAALDAGILSGAAYDVVAQIQEIEVVHAAALADAIVSLGGTPVEAPEFMVPEAVLASQQAFLEAALVQEQKDVGANLGLGPMIQSPDILAAAGAINGAEAENVTAIKNLLGVVPPANEPFPAALTQDEVLAILAPYMGMGSMMETGGPAPAGGVGDKRY
ncbi:hypothetical protein GBA65_11735 [Rubrobacter marinus]|uniref:Ferritin-like domain-containing protein n=1 Tax=Rubrobacter marinus TaxID=2653852 RepID=A0A6G8PXZ1_9ACTN|nr:ferritin-like domain-containing protein [Rubrobacter marinus]QIN79081.1 hypothetical protein GBA65_11735 [Rubrobacter marinus]